MRAIIAFVVSLACWGEPRTPVLKRTPASNESQARIELPAPLPVMIPEPDKTMVYVVPPLPAVPRSTGLDGSLVYQYGHGGVPLLVCALLRACIVELEAGEKILGEPILGDTVRWEKELANYGIGEDMTPMIVLKPTRADIETNLVIATTRRVYSIRLVAKQTEYTSRVAFHYPENDAKKWAAQAVAVKIAEAPKPQQIIAPVEKLYFGYRVTGGKDWMRPVRVFDDGSKTYMQMPPAIASREAPALLVFGDDGKAIMSNYRVNGGTYILDRLFDRAQFVLGSGKKAKKVDMVREPKEDS